MFFYKMAVTEELIFREIFREIFLITTFNLKNSEYPFYISTLINDSIEFFNFSL